MKNLKYFLILFLFPFIFSCSSDDDANPVNEDELIGLVKIQELSNDAHIVELYSKNGILEQGYNVISLRIKDKNSGNYLTDVSLSWNPVMYMSDMQHACPKSALVKTVDKQTLYNGYVVFQMPSNDMEYWKLTIDYSVDGNDYSVFGNIQVHESDKQRVASFSGTDGKHYVLALIEPSTPKAAVNDMVVGLFEMENMTQFSIVDDYSIIIDPRMPSMGNHGSPNNENLTQQSNGFYHGKLSLTMTGYWKINLQLLNDENQVLKGEEVTDENESSSLYLEVEF